MVSGESRPYTAAFASPLPPRLLHRYRAWALPLSSLNLPISPATSSVGALGHRQQAVGSPLWLCPMLPGPGSRRCIVEHGLTSSLTRPRWGNCRLPWLSTTFDRSWELSYNIKDTLFCWSPNYTLKLSQKYDFQPSTTKPDNMDHPSV